MHITLDSGESVVYEATRDVFNSDHNLGQLDAGSRVFFREDRDGSEDAGKERGHSRTLRG